jgi:hypothetical protein
MSRKPCQACGKELDGPATFPIPGIMIAKLCVQCRQDFQRVMMVDYPELTARFDESIGRVNQARSGFPSASGLGADEDIFKDHVEREQQMIRMWDEFIKSKQEENEQGETSPSSDSD